MEKYFYFYYLTGSNTRQIHLIPKENYRVYKTQINVSELEGIILSDNQIKPKDWKFSITQKEKIEKKYSAQIISFQKRYNKKDLILK